jgi:hypothetical protein
MNYKNLTILLFPIISICGYAQKLPVLKSNAYVIDVRDGNSLNIGVWGVDSKTKLDIYETGYIDNGKEKWITFISDIDSIRFKVEKDKEYPFIILVNGKDSAFTKINCVQEVPFVHFTKEYIKEHDGKTFVEIPEVYELVNIVFALTNTGKNSEGLVVKNINYYNDVIYWFDKYKQEPIILKMDSILFRNTSAYFSLKMDAYAFDIVSNTITQSSIYNRISWGKTNQLKPLLAELQSFYDKTQFHEFYKKHKSFYSSQINTYRDTLGLPEMQKWLNKNFPTTHYNSIKVIFSPLVGWNQSTNWFESNGFNELQPHVNFPYRTESDSKDFSVKALNIKDGNIVFTEMNHGFINPEGQKTKYQKSIREAFLNLTVWNEKDKPAEQQYNNAYSCFNEYMNWALISLRYIDFAPKNEQEKLILKMENGMVEYRGFRKFAEFDQYLITIYKNREKGQTVAELYPKIVQWFVDNK